LTGAGEEKVEDYESIAPLTADRGWRNLEAFHDKDKECKYI
jgi:hypothetical protein